MERQKRLTLMLFACSLSMSLAVRLGTQWQNITSERNWADGNTPSLEPILRSIIVHKFLNVEGKSEMISWDRAVAEFLLLYLHSLLAVALVSLLYEVGIAARRQVEKYQITLLTTCNSRWLGFLESESAVRSWIGVSTPGSVPGGICGLAIDRACSCRFDTEMGQYLAELRDDHRQASNHFWGAVMHLHYQGICFPDTHSSMWEALHRGGRNLLLRNFLNLESSNSMDGLEAARRGSALRHRGAGCFLVWWLGSWQFSGWCCPVCPRLGRAHHMRDAIHQWKREMGRDRETVSPRGLRH